MATNGPDLFSETSAERARILALLEGLTPQQWASASLCTGWSIREVAAHMTMPFRTSALRILTGMIRAGFSFDRYADGDARTTAAAMSDEELLAVLRDNLSTPWQPPGGSPVDALSHDIIHGLDITEPLRLPAPPPERIALVLAHAPAKMLKHFGAPLRGKRLVATDAELDIGQGTPLHLPAKDILLFVSCRRALPDTEPDSTPGDGGHDGAAPEATMWGKDRP